MSMPIEEITVHCPNCNKDYKDWHRGSLNCTLEDFDDEYIDRATSSTCPHCKHKVHHDALVVGKDGVWKNASSRSRAKSWPYPRHRKFEGDLRQAAADWFASKGYKSHHRMPYLLAEWKDWPKNMVCPEVADYIQKESEEAEAAKQSYPLHKYIHHGLSSQAMVFNLIGPLIVAQDFEPLRIAFERQGIVWPEGEVTAEFEYDDRKVLNEDSGQPTSIDLVIKDGDGKPCLFVEAKMVEREFGGCSVFAKGDCDGANPADDMSQCYLHHIGRRYWTLLAKHGFLKGKMAGEAVCTLALHYQFFREVLFALELGGTFVLLSDERSPTFFCNSKQEGKSVKGLMPLLLSLVPESLHDRVKAVSIQQVVAAIEESGRFDWISDFKEKYGII